MTQDAGAVDARSMSFWSHVRELRIRLVIVVLTLAVLVTVAFICVNPLFRLLILPLPTDVGLNFIGIAEAFLVKFKLALVAGLIASSPVVVGQLWGFVRPALKDSEVKYAVPVVPAVLLLFLAGVVFTFLFVIPPAVMFLLQFAGDKLQPVLMFDSYFTFVVGLSVAGGLLFEMPVVLAFLAKLGIVTYAGMAKHWRIAVVIILILAAALTPTPDAITMSILAAPIIALYFASMWIVKMTKPINK